MGSFADTNGPSVFGFVLGALLITGLITWALRAGLRAATSEPVSRAGDGSIGMLVAVVCVGLTYVVQPEAAAAPEPAIDYSRRVVVNGEAREFETAEEAQAFLAGVPERLRPFIVPDSPAARAARRSRRESDPVWVLEHARIGNVVYPATSLFWALVNLGRPRARRARAVASHAIDPGKTEILTPAEHDEAARRSRRAGR